MTLHYTTEDLLTVLSEPNSLIETHVNECLQCRTELEQARAFEEALCDPLSWSISDTLTIAASRPSEALRVQVGALDRAGHDAIALMEPILTSPTAFKEAQIEHQRAYRTPEVVRLLCTVARENRDRQPQFSLMLASAATELSSKMQLSAVQGAELEGTSWLERGVACGALGKYREALAALRRAEEVFNRDRYSNAWNLANVWLSQAYVLVETDQSTEALQVAERAAEVYVAFGDASREVRALLVRAGVLYTQGDYQDSLAIYETVLARAERQRDLMTAATAIHNIGNCHLGTQAWGEAKRAYNDALARWDQLGVDTQQARAAWALATILVRSGQVNSGIDALENARREMLALGLENDEALVRLEMAEALLGMKRRSEVSVLLDGIVLKFASEGMMRNARMALAYLKEAESRGDIRASEIRHVRQYLERLPSRGTEAFLPLA
jgi:tetratricopeptide (TPR) repeat protein